MTKTPPSKLILVNKTDLPIDDLIIWFQSVTRMGRISNDGKQYCYLSSFTIEGDEYHIVSDLNKRSDKLTIYKAP